MLGGTACTHAGEVVVGSSARFLHCMLLQNANIALMYCEVVTLTWSSQKVLAPLLHVPCGWCRWVQAVGVLTAAAFMEGRTCQEIFDQPISERAYIEASYAQDGVMCMRKPPTNACQGMLVSNPPLSFSSHMHPLHSHASSGDCTSVLIFVQTQLRKCTLVVIIVQQSQLDTT